MYALIASAIWRPSTDGLFIASGIGSETDGKGTRVNEFPLFEIIQCVLGITKDFIVGNKNDCLASLYGYVRCSCCTQRFQRWHKIGMCISSLEPPSAIRYTLTEGNKKKKSNLPSRSDNFPSPRSQCQ